jgi:hypothetical protein
LTELKGSLHTHAPELMPRCDCRPR